MIILLLRSYSYISKVVIQVVIVLCIRFLNENFVTRIWNKAMRALGKLRLIRDVLLTFTSVKKTTRERKIQKDLGLMSMTIGSWKLTQLKLKHIQFMYPQNVVSLHIKVSYTNTVLVILLDFFAHRQHISTAFTSRTCKHYGKTIMVIVWLKPGRMGRRVCCVSVFWHSFHPL